MPGGLAGGLAGGLLIANYRRHPSLCFRSSQAGGIAGRECCRSPSLSASKWGGGGVSVLVAGEGSGAVNPCIVLP